MAVRITAHGAKRFVAWETSAEFYLKSRNEVSSIAMRRYEIHNPEVITSAPVRRFEWSRPIDKILCRLG
jgi:hypothetical protein